MAEALRQRGRRDQAMESYRAALELDAGFAPAHAGLGIALFQSDRHAEVIKAMARAPVAARPAGGERAAPFHGPRRTSPWSDPRRRCRAMSARWRSTRATRKPSIVWPWHISGESVTKRLWDSIGGWRRSPPREPRPTPTSPPPSTTWGGPPRRYGALNRRFPSTRTCRWPGPERSTCGKSWGKGSVGALATVAKRDPWPGD